MHAEHHDQSPVTIPAELERETDPNIVLALLVKHLSNQRRLPRWYDQTKENDTEHSYMVSLYASRYHGKYYPDDPEIDPVKIKEYAEVHDWVEILAGDTVTLGMTEDEYAAKAAHEEESLRVLLDLLRRKDLDTYAGVLDEYESQDSKSARFVKAVDKLMPRFVNLAGDGISARIEHGITSLEALVPAYRQDQERFEARFGQEFPELAIEFDGYMWESMQRFREAVDQRHIRDGQLIRGVGHYAI